MSQKVNAVINLIPGHKVITRTGINTDIDIASVPEDLCGTSGAHAGFATSAEVVTVVSSSADDASEGTGAITVKITGLNSSWEEQSETITLNGTTSVDSTNTYLRVYGFEVLTAGSGGVTAGAITIAQKVTTANIFLVIAAGLNKEYSSQYTIPKGKTGYVVQVWGKVRKGTSATVDGFILYRTNNGPIQQILPFAFSNAMPLDRHLYGGIVLPEKTDILVRASLTSADNVEAVAGYSLILVDNLN